MSIISNLAWILFKYLFILIIIVTIYYIQKISKKVLDSMSDEKEQKIEQKIIESAISDIKLGVDATQQAYVQNLKKRGQFFKEEQQNALNKTLNLIKECLLNKKQIETIKSKYPNLDGFIIATIESYLKH